MRETNSEEMKTIERIIDRTSLQSVLSIIGEIAYQKAAHIREIWQDEKLADVWSTAGDAIHKTSSSRHISKILT